MPKAKSVLIQRDPAVQSEGLRGAVCEGWDQTSQGLTGEGLSCAQPAPGGSVVLGCPFVTETRSRALCDTGALLCPKATVTSGRFLGHRALGCHSPRAPFSGGSSCLRTSAGTHDRDTRGGEGESQILAHPGAAEPEEAKNEQWGRKERLVMGQGWA